MIAAVILVVIAVVAAVAAIMYFTEPAKSLPGLLGTITHPAARANAHRSLRAAISLVIAVVCLIAAWFVARASRRRR
jgi:hypothetical protein